MDRGHRKGLRLEADGKSRRTWLGLLIGAWVLIALLAWFDPFAIGHHRYQPHVREPDIHLQVPLRSGIMPRGVTLETDGFGALFAFGTITDAPKVYGTDQQLSSRGPGRWDGPWSKTEAWAIDSRGDELIGKVGDAVRVVAFADPGLQPERVITVDVAGSGSNWTGPKRTRLVLARGCLRLGSMEGPLVLLAHGAKGLFVDAEGWLTVGQLGRGQLRVGEVGEVTLDLPPPDRPALASLRRQCGGNGDVVQVSGAFRKPVCDLSAQQAATNRAALTRQQREIRHRMAAQQEMQITSCMKEGKTRLHCERTIPPMPPAPMPPGGQSDPAPFPGSGPGENCIAQEDLPPGAWTPPDQPS